MRRRQRALDAGCPVNWAHPLNRGLVGEWAAAPLSGWRGSGTLRDLVRGGKQPHDGTAAGNVTWQGASRPGGYGALKFGGTSSDYVQFWSDPALPIAGKAASLACWVYPTTSLTAYQAVFDWSTGSGSNRNVGAFLGGAANHLYAAFANSVGVEITLSDSWVIGQWQHLAVTCDGTTQNVYRNGRGVGGSAAGVGTGMATAAGAKAQWGGNPSGGGAAFAGSSDALCLWSRALSAAEVMALYQESLRGNPSRWRWLGTAAWFVPPLPPGTVAARALVVGQSVANAASL